VDFFSFPTYPLVDIGLRRLYEASDMISLLFFDPADRHRQHDAKSQPAAHLHFFHAPDRMARKSERYLQSAVYPFHRGSFGINPSPFVTGPVNGRKDPPIFRKGYPYPAGNGAGGLSRTGDPVLFGGTSFFERIPVFFKASACHFSYRSRFRTMAIDIAFVIVGGVFF